jgi:hypothetical protein
MSLNYLKYIEYKKKYIELKQYGGSCIQSNIAREVIMFMAGLSELSQNRKADSKLYTKIDYDKITTKDDAINKIKDIIKKAYNDGCKYNSTYSLSRLYSLYSLSNRKLNNNNEDISSTISKRLKHMLRNEFQKNYSYYLTGVQIESYKKSTKYEDEFDTKNEIILLNKINLLHILILFNKCIIPKKDNTIKDIYILDIDDLRNIFDHIIEISKPHDIKTMLTGIEPGKYSPNNKYIPETTPSELIKQLDDNYKKIFTVVFNIKKN